jgi:AcrR family transcriptional regulator
MTEAVDARILRTRAVVSDAMQSLFEEEGPAALTHQRVANRAGVGRATVYRHWPTTTDLLSETLARAEQPLLRSGDGPLRDWLHRELLHAAADIARPSALRLTAMIIGSSEQSPAWELRENIVQRLSALLRTKLDQAFADGELDSLPDADELQAHLIGALIYRVAIQKVDVDDDYIDRLIDTTLRFRAQP